MTNPAVATRPTVLDSARTDVSLADLTTLRVGGPVGQYVQAESEADLIAVIRYADDAGIPLLVIGGGSNIVAGDQGFAGIVVRDARSEIREDLIDSCGGASVTVPAGHNWDEFVRHTVIQGWVGIESLIGIPGTVGAAPVQNIGAYGQEISAVVASVRVYDRQEQRARMFALTDLEFSYRDSKLKRTMREGTDGTGPWGPSPRYIVLEVNFQFRLGSLSAPIGYGELARKLGVAVGQRANAADVAAAVLELRGGKGMLLDACGRPEVAATPGALGTLSLPAEAASVATADEAGAKIAALAEAAVNAEPTFNRWSAGSFFTNPIVPVGTQLPQGAPTYPVYTAIPKVTTGPTGGTVDESVVKTSAAWLIEQAGFGKGFGIDGPESAATLSTVHTLALTNRGGASGSDIAALARVVRDGVRERFGVTLVPEPVLVGITL